jgi:adenylylsulfate kinase-like enzyme
MKMSNKNLGSVIWVTGLSGSGKSTFANKLSNYLRTNDIPTILLDGDDLRAVLDVSNSHYSRDERIKLGYIYARFCNYIARQGYVVIIATIALYRELHEWNRLHMPSYIEILMNIPQDEIHKRNPKNLYSEFSAGNLTEVSGMDIEIDWPSDPHYTIEFSDYSFEEVAESIILDLGNFYER